MSGSSPRIAIIGGGASGIGAGKICRQNGIEFDIYETNHEYGGLWNINQESRLVYDSTHLISSRKNTQFSDLPMPDSYPHYPKHDIYLEYLKNIAIKFELESNTLFNTSILTATPERGGWNIVDSHRNEKHYNYLVVATGRLNKPIWPNYEGQFSGESLHAKSYTTPEIFKDKHVLVVGSGNSGCDMAVDAIKFAKKVYHSSRRGYYFMPKFVHGMPTQDWMMTLNQDFTDNDKLWQYIKDTFKACGCDPTDYGLPAPNYEIYQAHPIINSLVLYYIGHGDIIVKPDISCFKDRTVTFQDGSNEEIDIILYATGYEPDLRYFEGQKELADCTANLFLNMFHKKHDNLFYLGFLNTPSGFGNIANACGRLLSNYIKARESDTSAYHIFRKIKQHETIDLGNSDFIKTERHKYEINLWKFLKNINMFGSKLSG